MNKHRKVSALMFENKDEFQQCRFILCKPKSFIRKIFSNNTSRNLLSEKSFRTIQPKSFIRKSFSDNIPLISQYFCTIFLPKYSNSHSTVINITDTRIAFAHSYSKFHALSKPFYCNCIP